MDKPRETLNELLRKVIPVIEGPTSAEKIDILRRIRQAEVEKEKRNR
jgi:hypothetical protein